MAVIYILLYLFILNLTCTEILDLIYIQRLCQTQLESSIESTGDLPVDSYSILMLLNTRLYSKLLIKSFCFIFALGDSQSDIRLVSTRVNHSALT